MSWAFSASRSVSATISAVRWIFEVSNGLGWYFTFLLPFYGVLETDAAFVSWGLVGRDAPQPRHTNHRPKVAHVERRSPAISRLSMDL
jgi:hypothetical protein